MRVHSQLIMLGVLMMAFGTIFIALSYTQDDWLVYIFPFLIWSGSGLGWFYGFTILFIIIFVVSMLFMTRMISISGQTYSSQRVQRYTPEDREYYSPYEMPKTCVECGRLSPADATFCPYCGSRLTHDGML